MNPKFNLEKFLNALELDEDLALAELSNTERNKDSTFRKCPNCGTRKWKILNANEYGRAISCDKCEKAGQ